MQRSTHIVLFSLSLSLSLCPETFAKRWRKQCSCAGHRLCRSPARRSLRNSLEIMRTAWKRLQSLKLDDNTLINRRRTIFAMIFARFSRPTNGIYTPTASKIINSLRVCTEIMKPPHRWPSDYLRARSPRHNSSYLVKRATASRFLETKRLRTNFVPMNMPMNMPKHDRIGRRCTQ